MRRRLGAMHSLAMSESVLAELINMFGGKTFTLCLHNFARFLDPFHLSNILIHR